VPSNTSRARRALAALCLPFLRIRVAAKFERHFIVWSSERVFSIAGENLAADRIVYQTIGAIARAADVSVVALGRNITRELTWPR
jgi:hypothetical protein